MPSSPRPSRALLRRLLRELTMESLRHRFRLKEENGRAVVRVEEKRTGRLIRTVPPETLLELRRRLDAAFEGNDDMAA